MRLKWSTFRPSGLLTGLLLSGVVLAASSAHAERVIIAYVSPSTSYLPLMVAYKKGFLEEENFQVDLVRTNIGVIIQALMAGSVDYVTTSTASITARMQGIPAVVIGFYAAKPMDFLVGAKGINSARDLRGKTVGISAPGSVTHLLTLKVLQGIGLDPATDVNIRPIGGEDVRFQALDSGIIQAALLGSQGVIQGEKIGLKVIVASADVIDSLAFGGLATSAKKVKENPDQVRRMSRAALKGLRYVWENKSGTVDVIESWLKLDRKVAALTYDLALKSYSRNGEVDDRGILLTADMINARERIEKKLNVSDFVDYTQLREARKNLAWPWP
ncbi:MAG TPA: ABC transporter substrate-binding protein [Candidatus Acidoferrales bacterium]|nr:ABC transporter substrate-binding protein [Candidatus Acidoferrales bacterium]